MSTSEECIEIINFLVECGRKPDSFSVSFPYIHHFREKGGDSSLEGYIDYCKSHTLTGQTNINVVKRLKHIKNQVKAFLDKNPDANGISSIKYQAFSKVAANAIPF